MLRGPGRLNQSLAESSFDAWSKFYRPDENTPNAVVSYYAKGALVALALDLTLRAGTAGKRGGHVSLDDVMRALWQRYGQTGVGVKMAKMTSRKSPKNSPASNSSASSPKPFTARATCRCRSCSNPSASR